MNPRRWTDVNDMIRLANGFFVVFDYNHSIALIPQVFQRHQQPPVVPLMQPNRGFIQHIQHPRKTGPDLAGQPDPLALAARKRAGISRQRQVIQPDVHQKPQPLADFLQDRSGDFVFLL